MAIMEKLPATGRMQTHGEYSVLGYADEDLRFNIGVLESLARQVDMNVFKMEREHAAGDVAFNLRNGGSLSIVIRSNTLEPVGYSSQRVIVPTIDGSRKRIMFTSTRAIEEDVQGAGMGPETLRFSFNMHNAPDILAGIVGMPPPVAVYYESRAIAELEGVERSIAEARVEEANDDEELNRINRQLATVKLYPFFRTYRESYVMQEALDYVVSQSRYKGFPLDRETGLMKSLWEKDSTQLYDPKKASRRVEVLGKIMFHRFQLEPTEGDAMVIMGPKTGWRRFID